MGVPSLKGACSRDEYQHGHDDDPRGPYNLHSILA